MRTAFFTGLKGQGPEELAANVVKEQLQGIRKPLADFENRCL